MAAQRQRDRKIAVTLRMVNISHLFYTELQYETHTMGKAAVSASAVNWRRYHLQKNYIQQLVSTHTGRKRNVTVERTRRCSCVHVLNCSKMATPFSTEIKVCCYLDALVDCMLPSTWACSQLQLSVDDDTKRQCERRKKKKRSHPSMWVEP